MQKQKLKKIIIVFEKAPLDIFFYSFRSSHFFLFFSAAAATCFLFFLSFFLFFYAFSYFAEIHAEAPLFGAREGTDFVPYIACSSDCLDTEPSGAADAWWTGFYTSKPAQKNLVYRGDGALRRWEVLGALARTHGSKAGPPADLRNTSALLQHHDAVTGTSFIECTQSLSECDCYDDYNQRLDATFFSAAQTYPGPAATALLCPGSGALAPVVPVTAAADTFTALALALKPGEMLPLVVFHSLAWPSGDNLVVTVSLNSSTARFPGAMQVQRASSHANVSVQVLDGGQTLAFATGALPALSLTTFYLLAPGDAAAPLPKGAPSTVLSNGLISLVFQGTRLEQWQLASGIQRQVSLDLVAFRDRLPDFNSTNIFTGSNVYSWVPKEAPVSLWGPESTIEVTASGPLVWEARIVVCAYATLRLRLLAGQDTVQLLSTIGPLPLEPAASVAIQVFAEKKK
jgi:hypothetical protein